MQYEYPPDPPLIASMRTRLGTARVIVPPKQAPRAPVYGALSALKAWQAEQRESDKKAAADAEDSVLLPPLKQPIDGGMAADEGASESHLDDPM